MPNIRSLTLIASIPLLTTFQDPYSFDLVEVTTDLGGTPTTVIANLVNMELVSTNGSTRVWIGEVSGSNWTINTVGGYPGITASCAS